MDDVGPSPGGSSDASSFSDISQAPAETTEAFLERLSAILSLAWDGSLGPSSFDFIRLHTSKDFTDQAQSFHENPFPHGRNLEEHIAHLKALKEANPGWKADCFNFTASIHEQSGRAVVWFTSGTSGNPGSAEDWTTNRESVSKLYWRRKETNGNEWECYSHECIRGGGDSF